MAKQYKSWYLKDAPKEKQFLSWYPPAKRAELIRSVTGSDDLAIDLDAYDPTVLSFQRTPCDSAAPKVEFYRYIHKNTMVYYYIPINFHYKKVGLVDDSPVIRQPDYIIEKEPAPYLEIPNFQNWRGYIEFRKNILSQKSNKKKSDQFIFYDPQNRIVRQPQFLFCIHGIGTDPYNNHFIAARDKIREYKSLADKHNLILIAPVFERKYYSQPPGFSYPPGYGPPPGRLLYMEELATLDEYYSINNNAPANYRAPDPYLSVYQYLINDKNYYRADWRLNEIYDVFKGFYTEVKGSKFNIAGYSGGGQFVSRYMMCYPDKLNMVAFGGAKSFLFPRSDYFYPYGWNCANIYADFKKPLSPSGISKRTIDFWVDDLINMKWEENLAKLMKMRIFNFVGIDDRDIDIAAEIINDPLDNIGYRWQGVNHWERAFNYNFEMRRAENRLKQTGQRDKNAPFSLVFVPLVGNHTTAHLDMPKWLGLCWYNFPDYAPLIYNGEYIIR